MAMKENFLKDIKIGDKVELLIGPKEINGIVIAIDLETVRIKRENGKESVFSLEAISYYEITSNDLEISGDEVEDDHIKDEEKIVEKFVPEVSEVEKSQSSDKKEDIIEDVVRILNERGDDYFDIILRPEVCGLMDVAKKVDAPELKNEIIAIANSMEYALNQAHEISPLDNKIEENIKKIKRLIKKYPDSKIPIDVLGNIYYKCKCESLALETYEGGSDNLSAFVIADSLHNEEKKLLFAARHFVLDNKPNAYIYKFLLVKMVEKDDYSLCMKINSHNISNDKLQAYHVFLRAIFLANKTEYNTMFDYEKNQDSLNDLLNIFKRNTIGRNKNFVELLPKEKEVKKNEKNLLDNRSLNECPIFAAAEQARMFEKNLTKAERLYIQAIENNEKTGSATANLCTILLQQRKYEKCAEYLGLYGAKYMRDAAYNNIKRQVLLAKPNLKIEVSKYENDSKEDDYFVLAQKADVVEKDIQKAITYYKKAIELNSRVTSAIPNLVSIYARLEMYDEALLLLDTSGKNAMDKSAYLNLKISVLKKAKDRRYIKEIETTFNEIIKITTSIERLTELMLSNAKLLTQVEEYDKAVYSFNACLNNAAKKSFPKEKKTKMLMSVYIGLCNVYIRTADIKKAKAYASLILEINPNNVFANSIISDEDVVLDSEEIVDTKINAYITGQLEELSLSELKIKNLNDDGVFVGTTDQAAQYVDNLLERRSVNEEAQSKQCYGAAILIKQVLDREDRVDKEKFNEQRYFSTVANGACSYANSRLYRTEVTDNLDVARYFFMQPITIFNESKKYVRSWGVATVRYLQTFFERIDEIRREAGEVYFKCATLRNCEREIQKIMQKSVITDADTFTIGMIEFLRYNTKIKEKVLRYINSNSLQGKILDVLSKITEEEIPDITSVVEFEKVWDEATKKYYDHRKQYNRLLKETIDSLFVVGELQDNLDKLNRMNFSSLLNRTDKDYVNSLFKMFKDISRYNEIAEFDYKADTLKKVDDTRKILEENIKEYPTYFSYEKLVPLLDQIQVKILKESVTLYGASEPQLSVELSGDCSLEEDRCIVRVPIACTNRANSQNADNVQISIRGEGIELTEDITLSKDLWIGNGRTKERLLVFKVSDKVLQDKVFSFKIQVMYQYKKNMTEVEDSTEEFVLTVPLYNEAVFEPIDNNFRKISGGDPVHDKSMFFGRDNDISSIIKQIDNSDYSSKSGKCMALYGQTRTGKSSIMHHLQTKLRERDEKYIIVNMGSLGDKDLEGEDISGFLRFLLKRLDKELRKNHDTLYQMLAENGITINSNLLKENKEESQLLFNEIFEEVYDVIREQEKEYRIVLLIDEFTYIYDWIRQGTMTDRIMKFWKAFMQSYNVFAVIIGQDHMMQFVSDPRFTNDFGIMETMKVTYLSEDDAKRLIDEPILYTVRDEKGNEVRKISRFKDGALDRLYELTSGSAFLIAKVCDGLVEYLNDIKSMFVTRAHVDDYINKMLADFLEIHFDSQYKDMSNLSEMDDVIEKNKELLKKIAIYSNKKEFTPIETVISNDGERDLLDKLIQRDVVEVKDGERCKIKVTLYKEWLIKKYGLGGA